MPITVTGDKVKGKLNQLYQYLLCNHYTAEAKKLKEILDEEVPDSAIKKVKEMCTPRYLGDLYIQEFENAYKWWNFLGEVSAEIEISFDGEREGAEALHGYFKRGGDVPEHLQQKDENAAVPCEKN